MNTIKTGNWFTQLFALALCGVLFGFSPVSKAQAHSPEALFKESKDALINGDYEVYLNSFVPEDRRGIMMMKTSVMFGVLALEQIAGDDKAAKDRAKRAREDAMQVWNRHNLPQAPNPTLPDSDSMENQKWAMEVDRIMESAFRETYDPLPQVDQFLIDTLESLQKNSSLDVATWIPDGDLSNLSTSGGKSSAEVKYKKGYVTTHLRVNFVQREGRWFMRASYPIVR